MNRYILNKLISSREVSKEEVKNKINNFNLSFIFTPYFLIRILGPGLIRKRPSFNIKKISRFRYKPAYKRPVNYKNKSRSKSISKK